MDKRPIPTMAKPSLRALPSCEEGCAAGTCACNESKLSAAAPAEPTSNFRREGRYSIMFASQQFGAAEKSLPIHAAPYFLKRTVLWNRDLRAIYQHLRQQIL